MPGLCSTNIILIESHLRADIGLKDWCGMKAFLHRVRLYGEKKRSKDGRDARKLISSSNLTPNGKTYSERST